MAQWIGSRRALLSISSMERTGLWGTTGEGSILACEVLAATSHCDWECCRGWSFSATCCDLCLSSVWVTYARCCKLLDGRCLLLFICIGFICVTIEMSEVGHNFFTMNCKKLLFKGVTFCEIYQKQRKHALCQK